MKNQKNLSIETLRGIAILLVVIGHVIGSAPDGGMKIDFPHPLRYLYVWIDYIQMPLFTAIAGWVYALKPFSHTVSFSEFARKKALRLLVPMAVVGTIYFLVQYFMPGTNNKGELSQMWRIYVYPYTIYWYLPSLFLIFMIQWVVDRYKRMETMAQWTVWCLVAIVLSLINDEGIVHSVPNLFSFKGTLGQLPYFFAGVAAYRFAVDLYRSSVKWLLWIMALSGIALIQVVWFYPGEYASLSRIIYPITLIPTLFLLLELKWHNCFFTWIGGYAYSIYLFHGFGTSGGRILLRMVGVKAVMLIFIFATCIATFCPIVVELLMSRFKWGRKLLLGKN
ncbi:MAG TPA: acyltransferase [Bacteroides cellulosilyticus]|jgi:hypothetical protein|nr:acyltransferase [Bacteroides cellulosilyticus]